MKKLTALLLVVMLFVLTLASCEKIGNTGTNTSPETSTPLESIEESESPSESEQNIFNESSEESSVDSIEGSSDESSEEYSDESSEETSEETSEEASDESSEETSDESSEKPSDIPSGKPSGDSSNESSEDSSDESSEDSSDEPSEPKNEPTHAGTENDPYTVADALIVLGNLTPNGSNTVATTRVYVKGTVVDGGSWSRNYTYVKGITITDGNGNNLYINTANPTTYDDYCDLLPGDELLLDGFLRVYMKSGQLVREMGSYNNQYTYFTITAFVDEDGGSGSVPPAEKMPTQAYDPEDHTEYDDILHDAMKEYATANPDNYYQLSVGLPSQGNYSALVIPVEFPNDTFTSSELADLEKVFNGSAEDTGWQSVSSYYTISSYNKLNLSFDIYDTPIMMPQNSSAYELSGTDDYGYVIDDKVQNILDHVLGQIDPSVDLSQYDTNDDGYIDAVYLIYSVPMDYESSTNHSNYWAYVTWHFSSDTYDGVKAHYYLFASVDFMYEDIQSDTDSKAPINGLKLNAVTYIHETGHLLGLDDYYDYDIDNGSNKGLGGSDIMDFTEGDHNVYSKLMLGWITPTVVTSTQELTISSSTETGQFIMILLDYDGTYFSEYLLVDLYTATGLNELHASQSGSFLYYDVNDEYEHGAEFGARIYHVSSSIKTPFNDDYYSFTDNNNSKSSIPLIKLVEADGDDNFESSTYDGTSYASSDDLWQTGDSFSAIQPNYTRNDGKGVNFDITFTSVSATSATVSITFN